MARIVVRRMSTIVQVGDDEIELVESEEDEIGLLEEFQVQPKVVKENTETIDTSATAAPSFSSLKKSDDVQQKQHSLDDIRILQEKMKDLRVEVEQAEDLDPQKRLTMEKLLYQVEGAIKTDEIMGETTNGAEPCSAEKDEKLRTQSNESSALDHIRRTTVAITGGTLAVAGVVLIPCPIIPGILVVYGGLLVLSTEFDSAKRALDIVKEPIEKWLADDDEGANSATEDEKSSSFLWEEMIGYTQEDCQERKHDIDDEFMTMVDMKRSNYVEESGDSEKSNTTPAKNNAMKQFLRKILIGDANKEHENSTKDESNGKNSHPGSDGQPSEPSPLSPSCHSFQSGCQLLPFDDGDDEDTGDYANNQELLHGQRKSILSRFHSDGSITLNTLNNDDDDDGIRLFSRQNTIEIDGSSSYVNGDDCVWVCLNDCNALLGEGCRPDSLAIEK